MNNSVEIEADPSLIDYLSNKKSFNTETNGYLKHYDDASVPPEIMTGMDLTEELASQIEYNNTLLIQLQDSERKSQELSRQLSTKDQELRLVRHELATTRTDLEQLREEIYQNQIYSETRVEEIDRLHDHLEREEIERKRLKEENQSLEERLELSNNLLSERNNEINEIHRENLELRKGVGEIEEKNANLKRQVELLEEKLRQEQTRTANVQEQIQWNKTKFQEQNESLHKQLQQLRENIRQMQHDRSHIIAERDRIQKELFEVNSRLQGAELRSTEHTRQWQAQLEATKEELRRAASENGDLRRKHYQFLGLVQKELREWNTTVVDLKERYSSLLGEMKTVQQMFSNFATANEVIQAENAFREVRTLTEERNHLKDELQRATDVQQALEVHIEEERTKTIMLEERVSKLESQNLELQRRAELADKRNAETHQAEKECLDAELVQSKLELERMQSELRSIRQLLQVSEDRERKLQAKNRTLTESIKKMQVQLEETKNLMNILQNERKDLDIENNTLRSELHERIASINTSGIDINGTQPLSGSLSRLSFGSGHTDNNGLLSRSTIAPRISSVSKNSPAVTSGTANNNSSPTSYANRRAAVKNDIQMEEILLKRQQLHDQYEYMRNYNQKLKQTLRD